MRNYQDSDYAVNKKSKRIVYRFADQTIEIALEDYLQENPDKTESDFAELKKLSDSDYLNQDRNNYRQTWKNIPIHGLEDTKSCAVPSPEDEIIEKAEQAAKKHHRRKLAKQALDTLTDVQRRRYLMYHIKGLSSWKIAEIENVNQSKIMKSLTAAEKKIKKVLKST
jgi:DNA-directed RNA polymerase specialized sigma24 family protein